jgi:hypothetical protein
MEHENDDNCSKISTNISIRIKYNNKISYIDKNRLRPKYGAKDYFLSKWF